MIDDVLQVCRQRYNRKRWGQGRAHLPKPPTWMANDELRVFFQHWLHVLRTGRLTWGVVIEAEPHLFEQSTASDGVGEILYSTGPANCAPLEVLRGICSQLNQLSAEADDENDAAAPAERMFGQEIPDWISGKHSCAVSTTYFVHDHLPGGYLADYILPVLVAREPPYVVVPLPSCHWPEQFSEDWLNLTRTARDILGEDASPEFQSPWVISPVALGPASAHG